MSRSTRDAIDRPSTNFALLLNPGLQQKSKESQDCSDVPFECWLPVDTPLPAARGCERSASPKTAKKRRFGAIPLALELGSGLLTVRRRSSTR